MDWENLRFDWNRARAFLATAEEGSLSAAARALAMAQPTLGRQIRALEEELEVVLFERVGRGLHLTESGMELLEHVRAMANAASRLALTASGQAQRLDGTVRVTASEAIAAHLLPHPISVLRERHPGITIELIANNAPSDLLRREADIAIRNFRPSGDDLIAKKMRTSLGHLYAADTYLEKIGGATPEHLRSADFIAFDDTDALLGALKGMGLEISQNNFKVVSANHLVQWELVKRGVGIGVMQEEIGDAEPNVSRIEGLSSVEIPMWLTTHRELHTSRRVRVVFDCLFDCLSTA